jgi:hypothetical protein
MMKPLMRWMSSNSAGVRNWSLVRRGEKKPQQECGTREVEKKKKISRKTCAGERNWW